MSNAIPMPHTPVEIHQALDIARHMAMNGIPIFIAPPCLGSRCTPDCLARTEGKGVKAGYHLPARWEETRPDPSVVGNWVPGMALCAVGGGSCDFLDIDPRNGGRESAERLYQDGAYPNGYGQQMTPSGGFHELIQPLRVGKGTPAPGLDVQGGRMDGTGRGFVFLAPTVRASKVDGIERPYRWTSPPDLPRLLQWAGETSGAKLAAMVPQKRGKAKLATDASAFFADETPHTTESADATIHKHCTAVHDHARRGWDGFRDTLNRSAFAVGAYVGSGYLPYQTAVHLLTSAIQRAGYLPDGDDLRWIETGIEDGASRPIKVVYPRHHPLATAGAGSGPFAGRLIDAADLELIDDPQAIIDGWLFANTTARLVGQPGAYKSFVALDLALCVALGREWHGVKVTQSPVLYVVGEGLAGYKKRVAAWLEHNGVSRDELRGKLLITRGSVQIGGDDWPALAEWVSEQACRMVVVDTVARATVGADENSSKEQGVIVEHCRGLCDQTGATMLLVHHTGHANGEAAERGRGSSSWRAAVDTEFILTKTGEFTGALKCDRQKDTESGQTLAVYLVKVAGSLAVRIDHSPPQTAETKRGRAGDAENDDRVYEAVKHLLAKGDTPTVRNVIATAHMKFARVRESLDRLSLAGGKLIKMTSPSGRGEAYQTNPDYSDTLQGLSPFVSEVPEVGV
jgi:hypothetical protein